MIAVLVKKNNITEAIRQLKRKIQKNGLLRDMKRHEYHLSRSERRKEKNHEALKRLRKRERRNYS